MGGEEVDEAHTRRRRMRIREDSGAMERMKIPCRLEKLKLRQEIFFTPPRGGKGGYRSNENPMMWTRYGISQFSYITVGEFFEDGEIQTLWQLEGLLRSGTRNWMTPVSGSAV